MSGSSSSSSTWCSAWRRRPTLPPHMQSVSHKWLFDFDCQQLQQQQRQQQQQINYSQAIFRHFSFWLLGICLHVCMSSCLQLFKSASWAPFTLNCLLYDRECWQNVDLFQAFIVAGHQVFCLMVVIVCTRANASSQPLSPAYRHQPSRLQAVRTTCHRRRPRHQWSCHKQTLVSR